MSKTLLVPPQLKTEGATVKFDPTYDASLDTSPREVLASGPPPMTVGQLIRALQAFPRDLRVFVDGYEFGLSNPVIEGVQQVELDVHRGSSVYGWHVRKSEGRLMGNEPTDTVDGIVIGRP